VARGFYTLHVWAWKKAMPTALTAQGSVWIVGDTSMIGPGSVARQPSGIRQKPPELLANRVARVPALFVQLCGPVKNHRHGHSLCLPDLCVNQ